MPATTITVKVRVNVKEAVAMVKRTSSAITKLLQDDLITDEEIDRIIGKLRSRLSKMVEINKGHGLIDEGKPSRPIKPTGEEELLSEDLPSTA